MKFQRDERRLDFTPIGLAIKRAREAKGMTQEDLAYVIDRTPRTIMYRRTIRILLKLSTTQLALTMFK